MPDSQGLLLTRHYQFFFLIFLTRSLLAALYKQEHYEKSTLPLPLHCFTALTELQTIFHHHAVS